MQGVFAARAVIDTSALKHNFAVARRAAGDARIMVVVKANAYGHDAVLVTRTLAQADAFAVARIAEAEALRNAGCDKPVVVLGGPLSADEVGRAARQRLDLVVHCAEQIDLLDAWREDATITVWLKFDSGMHRLGFDVAGIERALGRLADSRCVAPDVRLMTHLASADDRGNALTAAQLERFAGLCPALRVERTIASSAGLLGWPDARADWVRPGLMLYGVSPFADATAASLDLRPVMTLESRVIAVKPVPCGGSVGYGGTWTATRDTTIAIVAIGYADGYPWRASAHGEALIHGRRRPLVGRVSMDMLAVEIGAAGDVRVGDQAVLWGPGLPVEEVAAHAGTIAYELLCAISQRVDVVAS